MEAGKPIGRTFRKGQSCVLCPMGLCLLICVVALALCSRGALAQSPAAEPELRAASPFAGLLWQIDTEADETYLVMSATNGTATLYDLRQRPPKAETYRAPLRERQAARGLGVAISPDGALIALAASPLVAANSLPRLGTGAIYVFNRVNKTIIPTGASGVKGLPIPTRAA